MFWLLKREGVVNAEGVARQAAEAFAQFPHWERSSEQQRRLRIALFKILLEAGVEKVASRVRRAYYKDVGEEVINMSKGTGSEWLPLEEVVSVDVLKSEVFNWAKRIGVTPKEIQMRAMKRKWASCSSTGCLTFSADLLRQPARFRTQVIVHELLHLKIPNHGRLFRVLLHAHLMQEGP